MKVNEIPYNRVDSGELISKLSIFSLEAALARSAQELVDIRAACLKENFHFYTMESLANMRFTLNTRDEFYELEKDYYDEFSPAVSAAYVKFQRAFLANAKATDTAKIINPLVLKNYECSVKCIDDKIVPMVVSENKLVTRYTKLMAEAEFCFNGEKMPLSALKKYFSVAERDTRLKAYFACGEGLEKISRQIDEIFDKMVHVRDLMAKTLGYKNFVEMGDNRMGRTSYNRQMIATFRENTLADIVPIVTKLKEDVKNRLKLDKFMLYDNDSYFSEGNPRPILSAEKMFEAGKDMYHDMSASTGEFFDFMLQTDAFDVFPRDGKWGGGYCTSFIDFRQPFILANFNGSSADVDVLTHEAGHAYADYMMYKNNHDIELNVGGMETAETHSMSMEFFCWKYMDKFFGERCRDYKYAHLSDALTFIPYGVIVDYFQQLCYENPNMTSERRNSLWLELEHEFRPYLSADGIPYLSRGARWQYQMHIFENPLYYIDYCLAQSVALQFLEESKSDFAKTFEKYNAFTQCGGEKEFTSLINDAGLKSPFDKGALKQVAAGALELLSRL